MHSDERNVPDVCTLIAGYYFIPQSPPLSENVAIYLPYSSSSYFKTEDKIPRRPLWSLANKALDSLQKFISVWLPAVNFRPIELPVTMLPWRGLLLSVQCPCFISPRFIVSAGRDSAVSHRCLRHPSTKDRAVFAATQFHARSYLRTHSASDRPNRTKRGRLRKVGCLGRLPNFLKSY